MTIGRSPFGDIIALPEFGTCFKETINGFSYGHTPGMTVKMGERVRWYLMASTNFEMPHAHRHAGLMAQ